MNSSLPSVCGHVAGSSTTNPSGTGSSSGNLTATRGTGTISS